MPEDYLSRVVGMLGEPQGRYRDLVSWRELEDGLGVGLPADYKAIVDGYAPLLINEHLYLFHPATERWNLGDWVRSTTEAWSEIDWDWAEPDGDPRASLGGEGLVFGTADGLIPIATTDRGETIFYAPRGGHGRGALFVECEGEFFEYSMTFSEWLYRWLVGDDVAGPESSAFYPGPVALQGLPMSSEDRHPERWYGPPRGM
ncbi:SMI1/KNR4 family protein [Streptomyces sp. LN325]|uniref:SMI1/KNR4 family protein n=1 Tax=Streptomyces sp. LN325 TaxID=3112976 RepID=UPI003723343A